MQWVHVVTLRRMKNRSIRIVTKTSTGSDHSASASLRLRRSIRVLQAGQVMHRHGGALRTASHVEQIYSSAPG